MSKINTQEQLEELFQPFSEAGEDMVIRDRFSRYWIIGETEHGDYVATSFAAEEDDIKLPSRYDKAPIYYPVRLVSPLPDEARYFKAGEWEQRDEVIAGFPRSKKVRVETQRRWVGRWMAVSD